jgi:nitrate reductase beta subunit
MEIDISKLDSNLTDEETKKIEESDRNMAILKDIRDSVSAVFTESKYHEMATITEITITKGPMYRNHAYSKYKNKYIRL